MIWRALSVAVFACLFLPVPDLDFLLLSLLHHRSIVTHSVLPAMVLVLLRRRIGLAPAAGGLIGLSVHLLCDALSPAVGFGQIWLPAPFKAPLGPLSPALLIVNAGLCFVLAHVICRRLMPGLVGPRVVILTGAVVGVAYGLFNENSVLSALVCLIFPSILAMRLWRRPWKMSPGA